MEIRKIGKAEVITYMGIKYRRYPESKHKSHREYFMASGNIDREIAILHRAVWIFNNGPIPKGFHVHHKNDDRNENELFNLELIEGTEHNSEHSRRNLLCPERNVKNNAHLEKIRASASEWHKSKEGLQKVREVYDSIPEVEKICVVCGKKFFAKNIAKNRQKCCSKKCRLDSYKQKKI